MDPEELESILGTGSNPNMVEVVNFLQAHLHDIHGFPYYLYKFISTINNLITSIQQKINETSLPANKFQNKSQQIS